jgi:hypothetical protein
VLDIKAYVPALILAGGFLFVSSTRGQKAVPLSAPIESVLPSLDGYSVRDQKVSDEERRVAGMTNYVARVYSRNTLVAFTTLVSYYDRQTRGKSIHRATVCRAPGGKSFRAERRRSRRTARPTYSTGSCSRTGVLLRWSTTGTRVGGESSPASMR